MSVVLFGPTASCTHIEENDINKHDNEKQTQESQYSYFEMQPDDIRFRWINHPLFAFEYPSIFRLHDINKTPGDVFNYNRSEFDFIVESADSPFRYIWVIVYEPSRNDFVSYEDVLKLYASESPVFVDSAIRKEVNVSGVQAVYLESPQKPIQSGKQETSRIVLFDYAGFIWEIQMRTFSPYPEPLDVQEAFDRIISTFQIFS